MSIIESGASLRRSALIAVAADLQQLLNRTEQRTADQQQQTDRGGMLPFPPPSLGKIQITQMIFSAFLGAGIALNTTNHAHAPSSKTILQASIPLAANLLARSSLSRDTLESIATCIEKTTAKLFYPFSSREKSTQTAPFQAKTNKTEIIQILCAGVLAAGTALHITQHPEGPSKATILSAATLFSAFLQKRENLSPKQYALIKEHEEAIQKQVAQHPLKHSIFASITGFGLGSILANPTNKQTLKTLLIGSAILSALSIAKDQDFRPQHKRIQQYKSSIEQQITNKACSCRVIAEALFNLQYKIKKQITKDMKSVERHLTANARQYLIHTAAAFGISSVIANLKKNNS